MSNPVEKGKSENSQTAIIEVSDRQIEIFARRLLPEIKRYFADEVIRKEFAEWQRKQQISKTHLHG